MFGTLSFVAMGKKEDDGISQLPFFKRDSDEVIYYDLGGVIKIAELCFPQNKSERIGG